MRLCWLVPSHLQGPMNDLALSLRVRHNNARQMVTMLRTCTVIRFHRFPWPGYTVRLTLETFNCHAYKNKTGSDRRSRTFSHPRLWAWRPPLKVAIVLGGVFILRVVAALLDLRSYNVLDHDRIILVHWWCLWVTIPASRNGASFTDWTVSLTVYDTKDKTGYAFRSWT